MLLGGDFRQTLPVIPRGHCAAIVGATIKCSKSWKHFISLKLSRNMRANADELSFANWLIKLGKSLEMERDGKLKSIGGRYHRNPSSLSLRVLLSTLFFGRKLYRKTCTRCTRKLYYAPKMKKL
jgi:hypothetical protein